MGNTRTVSRSVIDDICHRLKWLETAVYRLQNKKRHGIPIYDKDHLPAIINDGVIFFTADSHEFGIILGGNIFYAKTKKTAFP